MLEALEASGAYRATSLQTPWGADADGGETLADALGIEERGFAAAEDRATIARLMRVITPREREVLRLRFAEDLTQAEIGEQVGRLADAGLAHHPPGRLTPAQLRRGPRRRRRRRVRAWMLGGLGSPRNGPGFGRGLPPGKARRRIVRCTPPSCLRNGPVL